MTLKTKARWRKCTILWKYEELEKVGRAKRKSTSENDDPIKIRKWKIKRNIYINLECKNETFSKFILEK